MHKFTDTEGEEWGVELDTFTCRAIKKELAVDLLELDEKSLMSIESDDAKLVDVLSVICQEQIKKRELDERGFAKRLVGDTLASACEAMMAEVFTICRPAKRKVLEAAWDKIEALKQMQIDKTLQQIDSLTIENLREQLGTSSLNVPQSFS